MTGIHPNVKRISAEVGHGRNVGDGNVRVAVLAPDPVKPWSQGAKGDRHA